MNRSPGDKLILASKISHPLRILRIYVDKLAKCVQASCPCVTADCLSNLPGQIPILSPVAKERTMDEDALVT